MELSIILILELFSYLEDLLEMFPALGSGGLSPVMELQGKTAGHLQNTTSQIKHPVHHLPQPHQDHLRCNQADHQAS